MWNNVIFGSLLIAIVCTQCQSFGYPKVRPKNPLQLPPRSDLFESTNVVKGSTIQQSSNTVPNKAEEILADERLDKTITIPQVKIPADCTHDQNVGYPKVKPDIPLQLPSSDLYESTNVVKGSTIQQSTNTIQNKANTPEQIPADDQSDKTISIPQVTEQPQEDELIERQHVDHGHQHADHGADGAYNPHDDGTGWDIRKSVPGEPGRDYPTFDKVVDTSFTCGDKAPGYYADLESRCQIFRVCTTGSVHAFNSFLCPNGSLFNQAVLTCDWWPNVDCQGSAAHYDKNNKDIPQDLVGKIDVRYMLEAPILHPYKPVKEQNDGDTPITNNRISDTKLFSKYRVTSDQEAVTVADKDYTSKIRYTTPSIQVSTFESTPTTTGASIVQSSTGSSTQQSQTGTYDVNEKPATDSLVLPEIPANTDGNVPLISTKQAGDQSQSVDARTSSRASFTTLNTGSKQSSDPVFLSTSKTIKLQSEQPLFTSQISSSENDNKQFGTQADSSAEDDSTPLHVNPLLHVSPRLHVSPVVPNLNSHSSDKPFLSQNAPVTFDRTNVNEPGPEKITLLANEDLKKQGELLQQPNVIGTGPITSGLNTGSSVNTNAEKNVIGGLNIATNLANSGLNTQTGSSGNTNTDKKVIGGLNIATNLPNSDLNTQTGSGDNTNAEKKVMGGINVVIDGRLSETAALGKGDSQSETNKQSFAGLSKSIELPVARQGVQTSGDGIPQHYARILNQANEHGTAGAQNLGGEIQNRPDQTINQFENQRNQFANVFTGNSQSGTQHQALRNQGLVLQAQNIRNDGVTSFPSRFNANTQNQAAQSNLALQNQQQSTLNGYNLNQGFAGLQNQQGFQSNFGLGVQNGYTYNQGFTGDLQNHGAYNLGSQTPYSQNAFSNQNSFTGNQNADAFNPNFHEQNYQNFNYYTQNNGHNGNYEVSKNGAAQNYNGERLDGHTHTSYSGHNYAFKESTKVDVVPSLGFTLTEELGRASYASALISGLVQEKRGAPSANYAGEAISPSDVRYSSYQGPSSYLVPQSSVQRLSNEAKRVSHN